MPKVRAGTDKKWVRRASSAGEEYAQGVANPREDWAQRTKESEHAYEEGLTQSFRRKAFGAGVAKAGTGKWQSKALSKGAERFGPGVIDAADAYAEGMAPYLQVIESTKLPPRRAKGDPANLQRVAVMAKALRDKKLSLQK